MLFPILYAAVAVIPAPNEIRCDENDTVPVSTPIIVEADSSLPAEGYCLAIKSGKKGAINLEINAKGMTAGAYSREVIVITNDYANPIKRIKINFVVE